MCLLFGLAQPGDGGSKSNPRKEFPGAGVVSVDSSLHFTEYSSLSSQLKDVSVRIIHAGGREQLYQYSVSVAELMQKYPGMCVARPEVFKNPHQSILRENDKLLVGRKYYMIPCTTARKLKLRHQARTNGKVHAKGDKGMGQTRRFLGGGKTDDLAEESVCSAKDFYVAKERLSKGSSKKKVMRKKPFVPPIQKARSVHSLAWEPSLTSIQELSP